MHEGEHSSVSRPFAVQTDRWPVFPAFLPDVPDGEKKLCAVVGNCLQEVSPLCAAGFSAACKQDLIFIVWDRREEEAARKVLRGHREGERERKKKKKREKESERGEVSIQECAWASLGLTQPR